MTQETKLYPATMVAHWVTGPVNCCERHVEQVVALGRVLGAHVVVTEAKPGAQCNNCKHEAELPNRE